jgi:hypothetical protein
MNTYASTIPIPFAGLNVLRKLARPAFCLASIFTAIAMRPGPAEAAAPPLYPRIAGTYNAVEHYTISITGPLGTRSQSGSGSGTTRVTQSGAKFTYKAIDPQGSGINFTRSGVLIGNALSISGVLGLQPQPGVTVTRNEFHAAGEVLPGRIVIRSYGVVVAKRGSEMRTYELRSQATLTGAVTPADVGSVQVTILPAKGGSVAGSGAYSPGTSVTLVPTWKPGYYFVNWTEGDTVVSTDLHYPLTATGTRLLTANFAPVGAGSYATLLQSGAEPSNAGMGYFRAVLNAGGSFSAKVTVDGTVSALTGYFDRNWSLQKTLKRRGRSDLLVALALNPATREIAGTMATADGLYSAAVALAPLPIFTSTAPTALAGKFTAVMPVAFVDGAPPLAIGTGYLSISVSATGAFKAVGKLADGTPVSFGGPIGAGDSVALHTSLYAAAAPYRGSLSGVMNFHNMSSANGNYLDAALYWFKPAQKSGSYYRTGFEIILGVSGSRYTPPKRGNMPLRFAFPPENAVVEIRDGGLSGPIDIPAALSTSSAVLADPPNPYKLAFTINATAGTFSGSFAPFGDARRTPFSGVFHQTSIIAAGYFLGPLNNGIGQSGTVRLVPRLF